MTMSFLGSMTERVFDAALGTNINFEKAAKARVAMLRIEIMNKGLISLFILLPPLIFLKGAGRRPAPLN
jgi:hypothetical protein